MLELHTAVKYVKGIGPRLADALAGKGIHTVEDLLYYLPFRYEDRLNPRSIAELRPGEMATVIAEVRSSGLFRTRRMPIFEMTAGQIEAGDLSKTPATAPPDRMEAPALRAGKMRTRPTLKCTWFNATYLKDKFKPGQVVALYGKVEEGFKGRGLQIVQPQFEILGEAEPSSNGDGLGETDGAPRLPGVGRRDISDDEPPNTNWISLEVGRIVPIYESAWQGKLTSRWFRRIIHGALQNLATDIPDAVPAAVRRRLSLPPRRQAFAEAHWPEPGESLLELRDARTPAHRRLIFEELFFLELGLELKRRRLRAQPGIGFALDDKVRAAIKRILPFHPTSAQKRVLKEIAADMAQPTPMRRLLQGDVGSGKTIVALEAAIIAIENGYQVALMAPTEILATQHYLSARRILENAGYKIVLLTGSLEADRKRDIRRHIARGDAQLVIGTHALIEEKVEFAKLGLVIVDEQHRFGVMQRFKLMKKPAGSPTAAAADPEPDVLVMTATPIPRTLALTLYGDLDVSLLDELPPGRSPIVTRRVSDDRSGEVWDFVRKQVAAGHQAYIVYPVIEGRDDEQPALDFALTAEKPDKKKTAASLKAAEQMYEKLRKQVFPGLRVGLLHGRLASDDKEIVMRRFQRGEIDVLVSTTVIEVGVDVPNANIMVVEHAERFGLSQLHQLRGRIGRGSAKSFCVLMTGGKVTEEAEHRLDAMVRTTNGFEIAELDLEQRGPGEVFGTRQAGMPDFRVANILRDRELLEHAKREAADVVSGAAKDVSKEEAAQAIQHLKSHWQRRYGLVEVG
jgi:ATP-dependent DNA helicase RecG